MRVDPLDVAHGIADALMDVAVEIRDGGRTYSADAVADIVTEFAALVITNAQALKPTQGA